MNENPSAIRMGPDSAEAVIGTIAPTIYALEKAHGCEITVDVKADRLWLLLPNFPLPSGWNDAQMPISLVANGSVPKLYLQRHHSVTQGLGRAKIGLLDAPEGQKREPSREASALLSPEALWDDGWTCWGTQIPKPAPCPVGQGFVDLIQRFAKELRQPMPVVPPRQGLTDMDRVRRGLEPPPPVPPITGSQLFQALSDSVHGQEQALRAVSGEIVNHLAKIDPGRPAVLLAVGPTGVGKTRTAESIAPALNGLRGKTDAWKTVRINMSEYKEPHRISQLLGAPAGYVGHGEKSQLVMALSESPRCVLIFDEIEKSHPDFFEVLMAAMDEGVFTLPHAREVAGSGYTNNAGKGGKKALLTSHQLSCKESIIVLTCNLDQAGMVSAHEAGNDSQAIETTLRERLVVAGIKPEIVNRLGRCVVFLPISQADRAEIVLTTVVEAAREYGLEVKQVCPELVVDVLRRAPNQTFGARAERRTVSWLMGDAFVQARRDGLQEVRLLSKPTRCEAYTA